ncbi:hydrogenase maturation nickel metallochaperone HypA [Telmatospirillum sp. J64-1]|uniref:hydrogenase maturation nickel metallochaperone HypA n=1 Tax=Telmatospirillum sp. J64-1 TaxID=2502183 RepID=UPI00163D42AF|nr:hydrogenase maturation nickel metallochaperone HypA [Telmatospirillum sp. J64-1]
MHEMALAEGILQVLEDQGKAQNFSRVRTIWLELGQLAHADPQALAFCFDAVMRGSLAEGAKLEILTIPGTAWCLECGESVPLAQRYDPCPRCNSHRLQVTQGEEMRIKELEVE